MITVIIPVYNKEDYITRTLNSLKNQTCKDFKIIVINDQSTDSSLIKIKEFINDNPQMDIEVITNQTNLGVSYSRNIGIRNVKTDYLVFLDADDIFLENSIEVYRKMIQQEKSDVLVSNFLVKDSNKVTLVNSKKRMAYHQSNMILAYLSRKVQIHTNSWCIRKELLNKEKIYFDVDLNWGEDILFFSKVLMSDSKLTIIKEPLSVHYSGIENSLSHDTLEKIEKDVLWIQRLSSHIENKEGSPEAINMLRHYRLPAAITYRLVSNPLPEIIPYYQEYKNLLDSRKYVNGLRSIKLNLYYLFLKIKIYVYDRRN